MIIIVAVIVGTTTFVITVVCVTRIHITSKYQQVPVPSFARRVLLFPKAKQLTPTLPAP